MRTAMIEIVKRMAVTILIIIITIAMSAVGYSSMINHEKKRCQDTLAKNSDAICHQIKTRMEDNINILKLAADAMVQENQVESAAAITAHINAFQNMTVFERIDVIYPDNSVLLQSGETVSVSVDDKPPFADIIASGIEISTRVTDQISGKQVVYCYVPAIRNDKAVAIVSGVISCEMLSEIFVADVYDGKAIPCIVDYSDGSFIMDTRHDSLSSIQDMPAIKTLKGYQEIDLIGNIKNAESGLVAYQSEKDGKNSFLYYMPMGIFQWELLLIVPENTAFASQLQVRGTLTIVIVSEVLLLMLYFIWNLYNTIQFSKSKIEVERQLQISNVMIQSVTALSADANVDNAINELLKIISEYFCGDRSYIFEIDHENQVLSNTYEYAKPDVEKEIDMLQNVPIDAVSLWIKKFEETGMFYITDTDKEITHESLAYQLLQQQKIHSLIAVPTLEDGVVTGFMGVDNPGKNFDDFTLLSSIRFFVSESLNRKKEQEKLERLSFYDTLTMVYNRNKFNQIIDSYQTRYVSKMGVAYFDLNGLKRINDEEGHRSGDLLIKNAAHNIDAVFHGSTYRIGGDEFAVLLPGTEQDAFEKKVEEVCRLMKETDISISYGVTWREDSSKLHWQLKDADQLMYEEKRRYYSTR